MQLKQLYRTKHLASSDDKNTGANEKNDLRWDWTHDLWTEVQWHNHSTTALLVERDWENCINDKPRLYIMQLTVLHNDIFLLCFLLYRSAKIKVLFCDLFEL